MNQFVKEALVGGAVGLAAFSFSPREAEAQNLPTVDSKPAPTASADTNDVVVSGTPHLTGPLADLLPPAYDGPIPWCSQAEIYIIVGIMSGVMMPVGAHMGKWLAEESELKSSLPAYVAGGIAGALLMPGVAALSAPNYVTFTTTVARAPWNLEPQWSGIVSIPETDMVLSAGPRRERLRPGQTVEACVYVDSDSRILGWSAVPAKPTR